MPKRKSAAILVGAFGVAALCLFPLEGQERAGGTNDKAAQLADALQQLRATSKQLVALRTQEYQVGQIDFQGVLAAQRQLLEVELKLSKTPADRMKVLSQQLKLSKENEKLVTARYEHGAGKRSDVLQARIARMRIEISILEEAK
jgi:outer membrane protein TolC